ncbi:penicillin-binding protein activator LpoB [Herbaspirillum sp.]|uniref:penicillin-binding protein activator LpoB n=1 Tax=Herbaspirillum sp. TaxID=1890675 RepID=UPI001B1AF10C|nr:penicillin-binding protein activator LpoB [Herbaspirillum sp.]MBO9535797.1 penicillin-binding protein activator LpoB [Herbaspirillum sp.]
MYAIAHSKQLRFTALCALCATLFGCATPGTPTVGGNVQYGDAKAVEQVTNEFGSTDLQSIAESMARSLAQSASGYKSKPLVTIADVKNKTSEYIDTRSITDSIRVQLVKSGTMRFATDIDAMQNQTDELTRQNNSGLYKKSATAKVGKMQGAQYRIEGNITSIVKRGGDVKDVYYKFSLIMTDIEAGTIEWADEKEIRKTSRR